MLLKKLADPAFLLRAWESLNKYNTESYGLSGFTISDFKGDIENQIPFISDQIIDNSYKFSNTRAYIIPKDNGKFRPLQIPEIRDRVVLKALAIILEKELDSVLKLGEGVSFAYQKKLGVKNAVQKIKEYYNQGSHFILEADIENFFPSVDRTLLLSEIFSILKDDSLNKLIENGISQKVGGIDQIEKRHQHLFLGNDTGIAQGNPLSPLFSNFYLSRFDDAMKKGNFSLIRYADDFIVMCKSKKEAENAFTEAQSTIENKLKLKLHPLHSDKTKIVQPNKTLFSFLSVTFDGKELFPSKESTLKFLKNIDKLCNDPYRAKDLLTVLFKVRNSVDGWVSSYSYTKHDKYFELIDTHVNQQILSALKRFGWKLDALGKVKPKYRRKSKGKLDSGTCLSHKQRKHSGIPFCKEISTLRSSKNVGVIKNPKNPVTV